MDAAAAAKQALHTAVAGTCYQVHDGGSVTMSTDYAPRYNLRHAYYISNSDCVQHDEMIYVMPDTHPGHAQVDSGCDADIDTEHNMYGGMDMSIAGRIVVMM